MFVFILRVKEYSETWLFVYPSLHYPPPHPHHHHHHHLLHADTCIQIIMDSFICQNQKLKLMFSKSNTLNAYTS